MVRQFDRVRILSGPCKGREGCAVERYGNDWKVKLDGSYGLSTHVPNEGLEVTRSDW